jgi:hypothetical protein
VFGCELGDGGVFGCLGAADPEAGEDERGCE